MDLSCISLSLINFTFDFLLCWFLWVLFLLFYFFSLIARYFDNAFLQLFLSIHAGELFTATAGRDFTPHVITVYTGEVVRILLALKMIFLQIHLCFWHSMWYLYFGIHRTLQGRSLHLLKRAFEGFAFFLLMVLSPMLQFANPVLLVVSWHMRHGLIRLMPREKNFAFLLFYAYIHFNLLWLFRRTNTDMIFAVFGMSTAFHFDSRSMHIHSILHPHFCNSRRRYFWFLRTLQWYG